MLAIPLNELTAAQIVSAVRAGEVTCEAVARACLDRIQAREPVVQAWEHLGPEAVLRRARELDRAGARGPLAGVPFGVKDIIDSSDMPSQYGSPVYAGHQPKGDAACIAMSRKADAVLMGKTVTTEFAYYQPGKTRNPLDPARTPGGSSSGSAAAVADAMVPLAIGTQTTGSTIKPASFCGVFGYRPTFGDLSCVGVKQSAGSLDTLGLYARSIEDIALYRDALLGVPHAPPANDGAAPRIGFCRTHLWGSLEPSTQRLFEDVAQALRAAGASVTDVAVPEVFEQMPGAHRTIAGFEFSRNYTWEIENHWDELSDTVRNWRIKDGLECSFEEYVDARSRAERARFMLDDIFDDYDVLLTSPVLGEAPVGLETTGDSRMCAIWTVTHVPAVTMPVLRGPAGMPIGVQFVARRNRDRQLFDAVRWAYPRLIDARVSASGTPTYG